VSAYVYRVYDAKGALLYVGYTGNFDVRWKQHSQVGPRWMFEVAEVVVKEFRSIHGAQLHEAEAIRTEHPRWNIRGRSPEHPDGRGYCTDVIPALRDRIAQWRLDRRRFGYDSSEFLPCYGALPYNAWPAMTPGAAT
jgi:predicted GIY-YIG superfamily endonuclease